MLTKDGSAMSSDGSRIVYIIRESSSDALILFDRLSGLRIPLNRGADGSTNGSVLFPVISADGQFVSIRGTDAVVHQPSDGNDDVFLFDLRTVMDLFKDGFE